MDFPTLSIGELILRVVLAAGLGGVIGFEREFSDQPAGFRTHILVALGSTLFTLAGAYGVEAFFAGSDALVRFDPTRVAAQVVTGIGFLGAGAIMQQGLTVRGLTTAAALWVTAAIGMAVAFGYWAGAVTTTITAVAALYGLKRLERAVFPRMKRGNRSLIIDMGAELSLADLARTLDVLGARTERLKFGTAEDGSHHLVADVWLPPVLTQEALNEGLSRVPGVVRVEWIA